MMGELSATARSTYQASRKPEVRNMTNCEGLPLPPLHLPRSMAAIWSKSLPSTSPTLWMDSC